MKSKWVQMECDYCGSVDYYRPGHVDDSARERGWIVTRRGKHFCGSKCRELWHGNKQRDVPPNAELSRRRPAKRDDGRA